jgi:hypothetical protein
MSRLKVLDFDCENRPLSYLSQDFTTAELTAIAAGWVGTSKVYVWLLGRETPQEILMGFRKLYDEADLVTGHYIREHDLPIINGALAEMGFEILSDKLTSDTKLDFIESKGISESQENLSDMLELYVKGYEKYHMSNDDWREANRLTKRGLKLTEARVTSDVRQHMAMRKVLVNRGLLGSPKVWRSK